MLKHIILIVTISLSFLLIGCGSSDTRLSTDTENKGSTDTKNNSSTEENSKQFTSAFYLYPYAPKGQDSFIAKLPDRLEALKRNGINTIFIVTNRQFFHYQKDEKLKNSYYKPDRGYSPEFYKKIAKIIRDKKLKIVIYNNVFTHLRISQIAYEYPELLLKGANWKSGVGYNEGWNLSYSTSGLAVEHGGKTYTIKKAHEANASNEPGTGEKWEDYWSLGYRDILDPLNPEAQLLTQRILAEVIDAFSVGGIKPDGIHLGADEAWYWTVLDCKHNNETCRNMSSGHLYADMITKTYRFIQQKYSGMDVYVWGDMLDTYQNAKYADTEDATKYLPKDIIIADWKYGLYTYKGYDKRRGVFKSIESFHDQGFRVLSAGWNNPIASKRLVWTGKLANVNKRSEGTYVGHIATEWYSDTLGDIAEELSSENEENSMDEVGERKTREESILGVASSIKESSKALNSKQCSDFMQWTGTYPNCMDCDAKDGAYDGVFLDYYRSEDGMTCEFRELEKPVSIISVYPENSPDNIEYKGNARLVDDDERGSVISLNDTTKDYVEIKNTESLNKNKSEMSVSLWFKLKKQPSEGNHVFISKGYEEIELDLVDRGAFYMYKTSSDNNKEQFYQVLDSRNWRVNMKLDKWYHLVWSINKDVVNVYLDGVKYSKKTKNSGIIGGTNKVYIGKRFNPSREKYANYFDGKIDDVEIFDHALSDDEVRTLYGK